MRDKVTIAIIGAGSVVFSKGTIGDILLNETLTHYPIDLRLMDIVPERLAGVVQFATGNAAALHRQVTAAATTDLRAAVDGADFVVTAFEVDRYQRWAQDFHIPRKYGFAQIYGENGGPGGMFHALRNMGPLLEAAHAMEELCPQAWLINYSNPEAKLVQAVATLTKVKVAGMCHGVFMGREQVSALLELPEEQIETVIALTRDIVQRHRIAPERVLGHADIAPGRKQDPGPQFPWRRLAQAGIILWPDADQVAERLAFHRGQPLPEVAWFQQRLATVGYRVPQSDELDPATRQVISTFQMKYRPSDIGGEPDAETAALLEVASTPGGMRALP